MNTRENTKKIVAGGVPIGGGAAVSVQSMCNVRTSDVDAVVAQIKLLRAAGCDIVRLAVPDMAAARAISDIKERVDVPLVADIHFDYRLALEAAARGIDKIRINPGNIGGRDKVAAVARECSLHNIPIRIGVNGGSLEKPLLEKYGHPTAEAQVGQLTKRTPAFLSPAALSMATPAFTSSTGSAVSDTRMVSPMPSISSVPMPTAELTVPWYAVPVSVTPRCSG